MNSMARVAVATLALATCVVTLQAATGAAHPTHACVKKGELRFRAADGTRLVGHRFGRGTTAVVLAHEYRGDVCQWAPYARRLASLGYTAIAFDFRGFGLSQHRTGAALIRYSADVSAAVR